MQVVRAALARKELDSIYSEEKGKDVGRCEVAAQRSRRVQLVVRAVSSAGGLCVRGGNQHGRVAAATGRPERHDWRESQGLKVRLKRALVM